MKPLTLLSLIFLLAKIAWTVGPIDFANNIFKRRLKMSYDSPIDLFQFHPTADADNANKYFTVRTLAYLGQRGLKADDKKAVRNEICGSNRLQAAVAQSDIGSIGVYKRDQSLVAIADNAFMGLPLDTVLRQLNNRATADKIDYAKYYAINMALVLSHLDANDVIWNNFSLRNFYVRPNGTLYAYDLGSAYSVPATLNQDKQDQRNELMNEVLRKMYDALFPNPIEAQAEYTALLTTARGNDVAGFLNIEAARLHPWPLTDIYALLLTSIGQADSNANLALAFPANARTYIETMANIPFFPEGGLVMGDRPAVNVAPTFASINVSNFSFIHHLAAEPGNNNFGIDASIRTFVTRDDNSEYADLATMCNNWTGR